MKIRNFFRGEQEVDKKIVSSFKTCGWEYVYTRTRDGVSVRIFDEKQKPVGDSIKMPGPHL